MSEEDFVKIGQLHVRLSCLGAKLEEYDMKLRRLVDLDTLSTEKGRREKRRLDEEAEKIDREMKSLQTQLNAAIYHLTATTVKKEDGTKKRSAPRSSLELSTVTEDKETREEMTAAFVEVQNVAGSREEGENESFLSAVDDEKKEDHDGR